MIGSSLDFRVHGRYKLRVLRADLSVKHESEWSDNLITSTGLNTLIGASSASSFDLRASAGSGNATPTLANTTLQNFLGACTSIQTDVNTWNTTAAPYYARRTITCRSALGGVVGNVSEVGMTTASSPVAGSLMFSRALVVDSGGNPTTVTVLSDEYLDVVWQFTIYLNSSSGTFNMVIDGVTTAFNYSIIPAGMTNTTVNGGWALMNGGTNGRFYPIYPWSGSGAQYAYETATLGAITGTPAGTGGEPGTPTASSYVSNSYQRDFTFLWPLNNANFATGIGSLRIGITGFAYQMSLSPKVLKINTKTFSHTIRVTIANL